MLVIGFVVGAGHTIVPGRVGCLPPKLKRPAARSCSIRSRSPAAAITPGAMACATALIGRLADLPGHPLTSRGRELSRS
jgi:hypothetical protein